VPSDKISVWGPPIVLLRKYVSAGDDVVDVILPLSAVAVDGRYLAEDVIVISPVIVPPASGRNVPEPWLVKSTGDPPL
jgi:hypothetical protein